MVKKETTLILIDQPISFLDFSVPELGVDDEDDESDGDFNCRIIEGENETSSPSKTPSKKKKKNSSSNLIYMENLFQLNMVDPGWCR